MVYKYIELQVFEPIFYTLKETALRRRFFWLWIGSYCRLLLLLLLLLLLWYTCNWLVAVYLLKIIFMLNTVHR